MSFDAETLRRVRGITRFFDYCEREVCVQSALTQTEADILAYLGNNPDRDTASDIVDYRGIPKGYVSKAVDALMSRGYLHREKDEADRRRIHLTPTDAAAPVLGGDSAVQGGISAPAVPGLHPGGAGALRRSVPSHLSKRRGGHERKKQRKS